MKKFKYTAVDVQNKKISGYYIAESQQDLSKKLAEQNLYLIKCKVVTKQTANRFFTISGKISVTELSTFCRQFSVLLTAGVNIIDALHSLKNQSYSQLLRNTLNYVCEDVKGGMLLSQALKKHNKIFPHFFCSMISVGEISGSLDIILLTLADYFQTDSNILKKVKSAMVYPIILIIMSVAIIVLMMAFVIPTFIDALSVMDIQMPKFTMALYNAGNFIRQYWNIILLIIFLISAIIILISKTEKGKYFFDTLKIKLPIMGKITVNVYTARFARSFGILLQSGMDVVEALNTAKLVLSNKNVEKRFDLAVKDIKQGLGIAQAFQIYGVFPELILQMISVGENTGTLSEMLLKVCPHFDSQAENSLTNLTTYLQPVILIIIGASVAVLFYAVYSPLLQVMQNIGV